MSTVVRVENLSKKYIIKHQQQGNYQTIREVISQKSRKLAYKLLHPFSNKSEVESTKEEFWALKDVAFEVKQGDRIGIIGRNGAGKSTLLKVLSRITEPTTGRVLIKGRVASLLEVGTGFHPELTGRENIYLNGAILGMSKFEIKKKFDEIVDFAEVEKFLDTPVKRYSSGMYVRLAFSVAAHLEPEILIVDEVLAVGDAQFQKKCLGKMEKVGNDGRTILFVSHNMAAVNNLCNKGIFLNNGKIHAIGNINTTTSEYLNSGINKFGELYWNDINTAPGDDIIRLKSIRIISDGKISSDVSIDKEINIEVEYINLKPNANIASSIHLFDKMGVCVLATSNLRSVTKNLDEWYGNPHPKGVFKTVCKIPANFLNDGLYSINVIVLTDLMYSHIRVNDVMSFTIHDTGEMKKEFMGQWIGVVRPKLEWNTILIEGR